MNVPGPTACIDCDERWIDFSLCRVKSGYPVHSPHVCGQGNPAGHPRQGNGDRLRVDGGRGTPVRPSGVQAPLGTGTEALLGDADRHRRRGGERAEAREGPRRVRGPALAVQVLGRGLLHPRRPSPPPDAQLPHAHPGQEALRRQAEGQRLGCRYLVPTCLVQGPRDDEPEVSGVPSLGAGSI